MKTEMSATRANVPTGSRLLKGHIGLHLYLESKGGGYAPPPPPPPSASDGVRPQRVAVELMKPKDRLGTTFIGVGTWLSSCVLACFRSWLVSVKGLACIFKHDVPRPLAEIINRLKLVTSTHFVREGLSRSSIGLRYAKHFGDIQAQAFDWTRIIGPLCTCTENRAPPTQQLLHALAQHIFLRGEFGPRVHSYIPAFLVLLDREISNQSAL